MLDINPSRTDDSTPFVFDRIADDLYGILRGKSHLVFANSRKRTEAIAAALTDRCEQNVVPNEFFPHHGSLSKEIRESLEFRLQNENLPTTAVCTMTLELGIDIGSVDSIAQVTAPHSVSSLRQRLGRSGRRGDAAVLRLFIPESEITSDSHLLDRLRLETFQCIAMVNLLLKKWYEPPAGNYYHLSTLVQQTLSVVGQYGGVRANQLWSLLCKTGPFVRVDQKLYAKFLKVLGENDLISQTQDGMIVLGDKGERFVEHYTFYAAFNTPEEYRLECGGRILGTVPFDKPLVSGQLIIFAGKRWEVLGVNAEKKLITLRESTGGRPPEFGGGTQMVHDIVRLEMLRMYKQGVMPVYLDRHARPLFEEGVDAFYDLGLDQTPCIQIGNTLHVVPWLGDQLVNTLTILLRSEGLMANSFGGVIDISHCTCEVFENALEKILGKPKPTPKKLANLIPDTIVEKNDHLLPKKLRDLDYGAKFFDVDGAWQWMENLAGSDC